MENRFVARHHRATRRLGLPWSSPQFDRALRKRWWFQILSAESECLHAFELVTGRRDLTVVHPSMTTVADG